MKHEDFLLSAYTVMLPIAPKAFWWEGYTAFETLAMCLAGHNVATEKKEALCAALRHSSICTVQDALALSPEELFAMVQLTGQAQKKMPPLLVLLRLLHENFDGDMACFAEQKTDYARELLLNIRGIGAETADNLLLYAFSCPSFVANTALYRFANRHGLITEDCGYDELRCFFLDNLPNDAEFLKKYHSLLLFTAKEWCRTQTRCASCPLLPFLEESHR